MNENENDDIVPKSPASVLRSFKLVCKRYTQRSEKACKNLLKYVKITETCKSDDLNKYHPCLNYYVITEPHLSCGATFQKINMIILIRDKKMLVHILYIIPKYIKTLHRYAVF